VRLRYAKRGKVRFTSHRDTARIWERAMRRAAVPIATSAGFTPRPRLSFGLALPTGAESIAEYLDAEVLDGSLTPDDVADLPRRLGAAVPIGFEVLAAATEDLHPGSLQELVTSVTWQLGTPEGCDLEAAVARALAAAELPIERERKGERRVDDVRPAIRSLAVAGDDIEHDHSLAPPVIVAEVATVGRGLRPAELAAVVFPGAEVAALRALRTHQWIEHDGDRREVLALPVVVPAPLVGA
jgi:radical SAM-linked protein